MQKTNERPERADSVADWEAMSQRYLPGRGSLLASMTSVLAERRPNVVVDLGCGPATIAGALADRFPDAEVVGVDHDPVLLLLAGDGPSPNDDSGSSTLGSTATGRQRWGDVPTPS